ncbi:MAG: DUF362 domain-containing protein [Sedimentisphaerales bacterium]|jgi:uncharacterized protein (DUF362 family)|nr:DUF362 domain-containing protein [Sedimentisphaerales bacterium]HNY76985.1 DUF362 domain-containing protein [Sedimentisphaerales bacterium]HOC64708.1 DUF362 domain-containing protein [Sedimentisphaerales bacterium]HOH62759.1 DUF362 domain-containing protein [Sedimentisphaerales bacterium]HPY51135.1 DUF362 domain-containing protein [Sedimentisphaerales bacterium]
MNRRVMLKKGVGAIVGIGGGLVLTDRGTLMAQGVSASLPDLVAVQNGEPDVMFDKAIEAIGGMSSVVKKDQVVVVKPNIAWDKPPETGANTNPVLVKRIVEHCFKAGARKVYVLDHTCHDCRKTYESSGIMAAAQAAQATVVFANGEEDYVPVTIPKAAVLKTTKVHKLIAECDVLIDVPVLKNHGGAGVTVAMKNLMGVVWDREYYHKAGLHECIADFCHYRRPDLNVVDAYRIMLRNGPYQGQPADIAVRKSLLLSRDIVAADAAGAKLFGSDPAQTRHIQLANDSGIGTMNLEKLNIKKITI